jgi:hypothetical protein
MVYTIYRTDNMQKHIFLTSHELHSSREFSPGPEIEMLIIGPPRTGKRFLLENITGLLGVRAMSATFLSALKKDINLISILRDPAEWIVSLVTQRVRFEPGRSVTELLDIEVPAALYALNTYKNFYSENMLLIKHEDLFNDFPNTMKLICDRFNMGVYPYLTPGYYASTPFSYRSCRSFPEYEEALRLIKNYDLSDHYAAYNSLLSRLESQ